MTEVLPSPQLVAQHVPQQGRPADVEQEVSRTADLVLKLAALAERYEAGGGSAERVAMLGEAVRRGRRQLADLADLAEGEAST